MTIFQQQHSPWTKTRFEWQEDSSLRYQYNTINRKIDVTIPLSSIYPEPNVIKQPSQIARILTFLSIAFMFIFAIEYLLHPDTSNNIWTTLVAETLLLIGAISSGLYLWKSYRERILFYFNDINAVAFVLIQDPNKNDEKLNTFKKNLTMKLLQAAVHEDEKNIVLLKHSISRLTKEKIISKEFENVLYNRLMS